VVDHVWTDCGARGTGLFDGERFRQHCGQAVADLSIVNPTTDGSARDDRPELRIVRGLAVGASADRLLEGGFTANQNAAVGLNLLLLTHLSTSAWWATSAFRGRRPANALLGLQARFLAACAAWAAVVDLPFRSLFDFA